MKVMLLALLFFVSIFSYAEPVTYNCELALITSDKVPDPAPDEEVSYFSFTFDPENPTLEVTGATSEFLAFIDPLTEMKAFQFSIANAKGHTAYPPQGRAPWNTAFFDVAGSIGNEKYGKSLVSLTCNKQ